MTTDKSAWVSWTFLPNWHFHRIKTNNNDTCPFIKIKADVFGSEQTNIWKLYDFCYIVSSADYRASFNC